MEAFTWDNLMRLKKGDALEKRLFRAIVIVWIMLVRANSWFSQQGARSLTRACAAHLHRRLGDLVASGWLPDDGERHYQLLHPLFWVLFAMGPQQVWNALGAFQVVAGSPLGRLLTRRRASRSTFCFWSFFRCSTLRMTCSSS